MALPKTCGITGPGKVCGLTDGKVCGITGGDVTAPTLTSATIPTAGTSISLLFSETVSVGAGGNGGWTIDMSGGSGEGLSYSSGSGSNTLVYTITGRTINSGETGTVAYTQPGNGIEDSAGNDLATIASASVTNNSTQGSWAGPQVAKSNTGTGTNYSVSTSLTGVTAGQLLVFSVADEGANNNPIPSSTPSLDWFTYQSLGSIANAGNNAIYAAVFSAGGDITISASTAGAKGSCALYAVSGVETTPAGAADNAATPQDTPNVTITTTRNNSLVFVVSSDWSAVSGTKTWRGSPTSVLDDYVESAYRGYHYYYQAATSGDLTVGLSAPTGQAAGTSVYEVRVPA